MSLKIISGGQTGVDRAALDFALTEKIAVGGWCPKGRRSDDGPISSHYPLRETSSTDYRQRTRLNILESDGTLILHRGHLSGGTLLTVEWAIALKKDHQVVNMNRNADLVAIREWMEACQIATLNVAGPRESGNEGIYRQALAFMRALFGREAVWMMPEACQSKKG
ncbi:MAG: putative molybdenum carrier protein [Magnetococcales bacterium]|nr:putative molybdenum carrier protein [Magnetococcales bacterium]